MAVRRCSLISEVERGRSGRALPPCAAAKPQGDGSASKANCGVQNAMLGFETTRGAGEQQERVIASKD
jgi:hypothetical protein